MEVKGQKASGTENAGNLKLNNKNDYYTVHAEYKSSLSIYLYLWNLAYIASLQRNYSEALPSQVRAKIKVLRSM